MKSKKTKRILSWILTLAMVIAMLPTAVFAADESGVKTEAELNTAIETVTKGGTVMLGDNITLTNVLQIPEGKKFTLDLAGHSIIQGTENLNAVYLADGTDITITSTGDAGTITGTRNGISMNNSGKRDQKLSVDNVNITGAGSNGIWNCGILTIRSGIITGGVYNGIYTEGTATVNGGEISGNNHGIYNGDSWEDGETGETVGNKGILTITGGTFSSICTDSGSNSKTTITNPNGIYNGFVSATNVTGGTFNGTLVMTGENPYVSGATINGSFSWWSSTVPTIDVGVTFGKTATLSQDSQTVTEGYSFNDERNKIVPPITFAVMAPNSAEGSYELTYKLNGEIKSTRTSRGIDNKKVPVGSEIDIIATVTANDGYMFDGWYLNNEKLIDGVNENGGLNTNITIDDNATLIAKFESRNLDSKSKEMFKDYSSKTEYTIKNIEDMDLFAYAVTNLGYDFSGKTIKLGADLDFTGMTYRVIGDRTHAFKGTFDAKKSETENYTICNISKITDGGFVGLFGNINAATVQNLTLSNCEFNASTSGYAGGIAAEAASSMIKNCKVTNVTTLGWFSGAVVGHTFDGVTIDNVTVESCTASGSKAGNVVGYSDSITIKGVNVSDVKDGAALIGHANAGTNVIENVTVNAPDAVLIGMTYSESKGSVTIRGENTNIEAKKVIDETDTKKPIILEEGKITVSEPTTVTGGSTITIGKDAEIAVEGSEAFAKLEEGAKVDKIDSDGKKTTVTVGKGGGSVDNNANLIIPAGSTIKAEDNSEAKTVENDAVMTPNGTVIEGNGTNAPTVNDDGSITVPAGGKVTEKDGTETTLNNGGSVTGSESGDKVTPTPSPSFGGSSNTADNVVNKPEDKNTNTAASTTATIKGTAADGTITATVDDATADKIVEKAVENKSEKVIIDAVTGTAGTRCEVSIPEKTVQALAEKTEAGITIKSDTAEVTFDKKAVDALAAQAGTTGMVKLIAEIVAQDENKLQVELKLITSRGTVSDFKGGNVSVTVKPNDKLAAKDIVCVHIDDNGACHMADGVKNADGTYSFNTGHFSSYVIMVRDEAEKIIAEQAAELTAALKLKARSAKTAKGSIKVTLAVTKGDIKAIEDLGYTVKYKFYRSKSKAKSYKAKIEGAGKTYINNSGKKGTKYYYKARVMVYDAQGKLIAKTELKQCRYACRIK